MNKIFEFLIEKRNKVLVMEENNSNNKTIHMEANIIGLGFKFSEKLKNAISNLSEDSMSILYENLKNTLKKIKGADVSYKNMVFPDFPNQTRMTSQSELSKLRFAGYVTTYLKSLTGEDYNALIGIGEGAKRTKRTNLKVDMEDLITLELGTMDDFYEIIQNLLGSRAALSESDKRYIKDFLKMEELDFKRMIPEEIPFKENMAFLYSEFLNNKKSVKNFKIRNFEDFEKIFKYVCFEDFNKHKLINLPNQKRIALLTTLEIGIHNNPDFFLESAYKNREFAIIINNRLHPISYKNRFPKTVALFKKVKEEKVEVSNAKIDRLINEGKGLEAIKVASINPGVAIRKLSRFLYCDIENRDKILKIVSKIAPKVDTNVLLSAKNYFETANNPYRIALPKGNISRAYRFKDKKSFSTETIEKTVETLNEALKTRLKNTKPSLNGKKVFINTNLSKFNVPFATRDESKSFRTVARGSRIKIKDNANVIRAFCYKKYTENKFVDLSASFVDENFNSLAFCSWQNFKNEDNSFLHSGDSNDTITGVAEFIDIDRELIEEIYFKLKDSIYGKQDEIKSTKLIREATITKNRTNNKAYVDGMVDIITSYDAAIFAVIMDKPDEPVIVPEHHLPKQYYLLMKKIEFYCNHHHYGKAMMIFDEVHEDADRKIAEALTGFLFKTDFGRSFHHILEMPLFVSSAVTPAIQFADIFAGIVRHYYENELDQKEPETDFQKWIMELFNKLKSLTENNYIPKSRYVEYGFQKIGKNYSYPVSEK